MRRRLSTVVLVVSGLLALFFFWRPLSSGEPDKASISGRERVRWVFGALAPDTEEVESLPTSAPPGLEEALSICRQCAVGERTGEICSACLGEPEPEPEPEVAELFVDVVNEDGRPEDRARVQVLGCPVLNRQGNTFQVGVGLECLVRAYRREGMLWIPSPTERVRVGPEGGYVQLELPRAKVGGLGISFRRHPEGVVIERVMPGTPAATLGLEVGDLITEVDGVSTGGLSQQEFVRTMTGPVGSEVEFTIRYRDEDGIREEKKIVERAFLERS